MPMSFRRYQKTTAATSRAAPMKTFPLRSRKPPTRLSNQRTSTLMGVLMTSDAGGWYLSVPVCTMKNSILFLRKSWHVQENPVQIIMCCVYTEVYTHFVLLTLCVCLWAACEVLKHTAIVYPYCCYQMFILPALIQRNKNSKDFLLCEMNSCVVNDEHLCPILF